MTVLESSSESSVVLAQDVGKDYGAFRAVGGVSFGIQAGECFGLLGPNGAGKSTLIKMIYGVTRRTSGALRVLGFDPSRDPAKLRRYLGVVMQEDALDDAMTVRDNMLSFCRYHGLRNDEAVTRVDGLLAFMELGAKSGARIVTLSGGMRRRLAFVRSLLPRPRLLILDEPTTGLDPAVRQLLWQKIVELKRLGTTIILTTHYMDEAELLCDRVLLVDGGLARAEGSPQELVASHSPGYVALFLKEQRERLVDQTLAGLTARLAADGLKPDLVRPGNLEDVYLKLTGKNVYV